MMSILELNDDCLIYIFQFLSIYELIEAEKVCKVFNITCHAVYSSKRFHKMRIELRNLRTEYFRGIFQRVGNTLRHFEFSGGFIMNEGVKRTMIDGVSKCCPKLKSVTINYTQFSNTNFLQLQECFSQLTCLDLSRCNLDEDILKITMDGERFRNVKTLKIAGNACMTGSLFKDMKHVEVLDVSYCFGLRFAEFVVFLKNCLKLIELDVSASCQLVHDVENFVENILIHQPHIETLLMDNTGVVKDLDVLSKFNKLKVSSFEGRRFGT